MKVLGIDPGYGRCGFAVLQGPVQTPQVLQFGVITTQPGGEFAARLAEIAADVEHLLKTHKPNVVSIEDLYFSKNVTTALQVSQVRGVISYLAHVHGARVTEPKPVEVKTALTGDGSADKAAMKRMATLQFPGLSGKALDDAIDAIAVGLWALMQR